MKKENKELTPQQQAAIYLHVFGGVKDRKILYSIAEGPEKLNRWKETSVNMSLSKWFNSKPIQDGITAAKFWIHQHDEQVKESLKAEIIEAERAKREGEKIPKEAVNFLNLDEFLAFANEQANKITDEKERRSWVELIGKYKNFKDGESEEEQQIRAYLPLNCTDCELKKRCEACIYDVCPVQTL
jgi:hypothetical protein